MPKINVTCSCGAALNYESQWSYDVSGEASAFHAAHAVCRKSPAAPPAVMEHLTNARGSLVGCFMNCESCGEASDCSDMDAVLHIDSAIAALSKTV